MRALPNAKALEAVAANVTGKDGAADKHVSTPGSLSKKMFPVPETQTAKAGTSAPLQRLATLRFRSPLRRSGRQGIVQSQPDLFQDGDSLTTINSQGSNEGASALDKNISKSDNSPRAWAATESAQLPSQGESSASDESASHQPGVDFQSPASSQSGTMPRPMSPPRNRPMPRYGLGSAPGKVLPMVTRLLGNEVRQQVRHAASADSLCLSVKHSSVERLGRRNPEKLKHTSVQPEKLRHLTSSPSLYDLGEKISHHRQSEASSAPTSPVLENGGTVPDRMDTHARATTAPERIVRGDLPVVESPTTEPQQLGSISPHRRSPSLPGLDALVMMPDTLSAQPSAPLSATSIVESMSSAQSESDVRTASAVRIQNWWRMRTLRAHFKTIKRRESVVRGRDRKSVHRFSHSRESSSENPLQRLNDHYLGLFNNSPKDAIYDMRAGPLAGFTEDEVEEFLLQFINRNEANIDKVKLGDLFGQPDRQWVQLMQAFIRSLDLSGQSFNDALRLLMQQFRLPGEAQKIDRILDAFSAAYCGSNSGVFHDASTAFVLAFSLIMLNTDLHNPAVKKKMSLLEFLRNNRGIDNGKDLPDPFLRALYYDIKCREIRMDGLESAKSAHVLKYMVGVEGIQGHLVAEFMAFKIIKHVKHERRVFVFTDSLIITKFRPGPKYVVNHIMDVSQTTFEAAHVETGIPNTLALQFPIDDGNGESNANQLAQIYLSFETLDECEIFGKVLEDLRICKERQMNEMDQFMQNRVNLAKAIIEKRYHSLDRGRPKVAAQLSGLPVRSSSAAPAPAGRQSPPDCQSPPSSQPGDEESPVPAVPRKSLRAARLSMQREATATAQALAHTRSVMMRSRSPTAGSTSSAAGSPSSPAFPIPELSFTNESREFDGYSSAPRAFNPDTFLATELPNALAAATSTVPRRPSSAQTEYVASSPVLAHSLGKRLSVAIPATSSPALVQAGDSPNSRISRSTSNSGYFSLPRRSRTQVRSGGSGAVKHVPPSSSRRLSTDSATPRRRAATLSLMEQSGVPEAGESVEGCNRA